MDICTLIINNSNSGGGGERVLWVAIKAIQAEFKDMECVVYTGDDVDDNQILNLVKVWRKLF